ncbi:MAG: hypothetical protein AAFO07_34320 [Bacteroidota bacterium]
MKNIYIDSNEFSDFTGFLSYMATKLMLIDDENEPLSGLDALEDALEGGFGVFEENAKIIIKWKGFRKSMVDLGYQETVRYYNEIIKTCHPSNREEVNLLLECAKQHLGQTLFFMILEVFLDAEHTYIELF